MIEFTKFHGWSHHHFYFIFLEKLYGNKEYIEERHRHRYEVNPELTHLFEEKGLQFCSHDVEGVRMEAIELESKNFIICFYFTSFLGHMLVCYITVSVIQNIRSSLFRWNSISPWIYVKASAAFATLSRIVTGSKWKTAVVFAKGM